MKPTNKCTVLDIITGITIADDFKKVTFFIMLSMELQKVSVSKDVTGVHILLDRL